MGKRTKSRDRGWRDWYQKERLRKNAKYQLAKQPWCRLCADRGVATAARIADHVTAHRGDEMAFWFGRLQSLCAHCHSSTKAFAERRGYRSEIDANGYPVDPAHPCNAATGCRQKGPLRPQLASGVRTTQKGKNMLTR
jgi:5-methylcytosine-specific restriction enzyme A